MLAGLPDRPTSAPLRAGPTTLVAVLCLALGLDQLLLLLFLGRLPLWAILPALAVVAAPPLLLVRGSIGRGGWRPTRGAIAISAGIATLVMVLGGEGRLVYANTDWQVRFAVLRDLATYPWPFVYDVRAAPDLLRAPLGMYLAPAAVGKLLGQDGAEGALLVQNAALLLLLFMLGASLFRTARARAVALAIFLGFSGMDVVGQALAGQPLLLSSQRWSVAVFGSHAEQVLAGPQHALAGWTGAVLFLLWRDRRIALAAFLTPLPLLALWSPLALAGVLPFAALAGVTTLARRALAWRDVALPLFTSALATPSLLYLASGSGAVGGGAAPITLSQWLLFELLEVGPSLIGLAFVGWRARIGGATLVTVAVVLLLAPFVTVSTSNDFLTRTSIAALAVLAVAVADALVGTSGAARQPWRGVLIGALALGLATPAFEIVRALVYPAAPKVVCSYFGVVPGGANTYVTPLSSVPAPIAPVAPARVKPHDPARCWTGKWPNPLYREFPERVAPADWDERL